MTIDTEPFGVALLVGLGATAVLDLWAITLKFTVGIAPTNWCIVGRWFCHMPSGRFVHTSIAGAESRPHECAVGWAAHYAIGGVYGLALVALMSGAWLARPSVLPALLFGLATMVFPFFVMQPCFGMGVASSNTPNPTVARLKTLMSHSIFGIGLYLCAVAVQFTRAGMH